MTAPKTPGRKPDDHSGPHHRRAIPSPTPDEVYVVPLPTRSPD